MPLIAPGINSPQDSASSTQSWMTKLMGKKIVDGSSGDNTATTFAKKDLPSKHRVVEEGGFATMDHDPDRLNIHVDKDGTVRKVSHG